MRRICVFCGSASGARDAYAEAARALGQRLAARRIHLVYGGSSLGIMNEVAEATLAGGSKVIGVMPRSLVEREHAHHGLSELHVVETMHERKAMMAGLADAFIALPGGVGTLEELFEIWSWGYLGLHEKPFGLLDVEGYYRPLIQFLDHAHQEGFIGERSRSMMIVEQEPARLLDRLEVLTRDSGSSD